MTDGTADRPDTRTAVDPHRPGHHRRHRQPLEPEVDTGIPDAEGLPADRPRGVLRHIVSGLLSYGVVIVIIGFLIGKLRNTNWSEIASSITVWMVVAVLVAGVANIVTNLPPQMLTLRGLPMRQAFVTNTASSALTNTVPEGGAMATGLNFAMLRSWGFNLPSITSSYLTTGIWTNLVRYGLAAVALLVMLATGEGGATVAVLAAVITVAVALAVAVLGLVLGSERFARGLGVVLGKLAAPVYRATHRPPVSDMPGEVLGFRVKLSELVRTRWHALTLAMVVSQLTTCAVLAVAVRMQGLGADDVSLARIVLAVSAMATASMIAPTPGGLGVAEVTIVAVLGAGLPTSSTEQLVVAASLFRLATWLEPVPIGAVSYLFWRRNTSWRRASGSAGAQVAATAAAG
jgi:putative heme transporter